MKRSSYSLVVLSVLMFSGALMAADATKGKTLSANCVACHNEDGNSTNSAWPKLAGQHPKYLVDQLKAFKAGSEGPRNVPVMLPFASNLSEADMADLAAYFSSQKSSKGVPVNKVYAEEGERIYKGGVQASGVSACIACHGPDGRGNAQANFPSIAGQHADYTLMQLKHFAAKERIGSVNGMMNDIAKAMTEAQMKAVSEYVAAMD